MTRRCLNGGREGRLRRGRGRPALVSTGASLSPPRRGATGCGDSGTSALDGLRGIVVLLVVVDHIETILVPHKVTVDAGPFRGRSSGVDIFFVLSGFLITFALAR